MAGRLETEFESPFTAWQAKPGPITSGALLTAVSPVIDSAIKTYGAGDKSPLLRGRARRLTLQAMKTYDPSRAKLRTHLMTQLQGLRRIQAEQNQLLDVPEQIKLDQGHLSEASRRLEDELGRDPSDMELADSVGLSLKRIAHIRRASGGITEGQLPVDPETGESFQPTATASPADSSGWQEMVYYSLAPKDQLVMEHLLDLHGKKLLNGKQLAAKLGVTQAAISQRAAKIQQMMDQRESLGVL